MYLSNEVSNNAINYVALTRRLELKNASNLLCVKSGHPCLG